MDYCYTIFFQSLAFSVFILEQGSELNNKVSMINLIAILIFFTMRIKLILPFVKYSAVIGNLV